MNKTLSAIVLYAAVLSALVAFLGAETSFAGEDWRKEFDEVCARTQDAMDLTAMELRSLIERCDKLKPTIEALDDSQRKVFLKRLQMCRDLYAFVLESLESKEGR